MGRLPRRPELPLGQRPRGADRPLRERRLDDRPAPRAVEPRRAAAAEPGDRPVRPRLSPRRHRRGGALGPGDGPGGHAHDLGHAALGERRPEPESHAAEPARLHELRSRDRGALLGAQPWLSLRPLLVRLERAEPARVPRSAVRQQGSLRRARELREALRRRLRGPEGRQPERADRDRRDLRPRQRQAGGCSPDALARQVRGARGEGQPAAEVLCLGTPPLSVDAEPPARPDRALAERLAGLAAPVPAEPEEAGSARRTRRSGSRSTGTRRGRRTRSE